MKADPDCCKDDLISGRMLTIYPDSSEAPRVLVPLVEQTSPSLQSGFDKIVSKSFPKAGDNAATVKDF